MARKCFADALSVLSLVNSVFLEFSNRNRTLVSVFQSLVKLFSKEVAVFARPECVKSGENLPSTAVWKQCFDGSCHREEKWKIRSFVDSAVEEAKLTPIDSGELVLTIVR